MMASYTSLRETFQIKIFSNRVRVFLSLPYASIIGVLIMFKTLTAFVVSLLIVGTASAKWITKTVDQQDGWERYTTVSKVTDFHLEGKMIFMLFKHKYLQGPYLTWVPH